MSTVDNAFHTLHAGQALTLPAAAGLRLRVVSGRVWVTQSGDTADHFLNPGQSRVLGPGRTVLEADLGPVRYTLTAAAQARTVRPTRAGWSVFGRRLTSP